VIVWRPIPQSGTGNVYSAEGWDELLLPEIERQQDQGKEVVFRADADFAKLEVYEALRVDHWSLTSLQPVSRGW
jgi:hypothetical protein